MTGELTEIERAVLSVWARADVAPMMPVEAVAKRCGIPLAVVSGTLGRLARRGLVMQQERRGAGWIDIGWVLTEAGYNLRVGHT